jgi:periplasmic protein TonB
MYKIYKILCIVFLISLRLFVSGQNKTQEKVIFGGPEQLPAFKGGYDALNNFIYTNLKYPTNWPADSISGKVYVTFTIDSAGNVVNPKILRGLNPALDTIAIKIFRAMPKWDPARNRNKPVEYQYNFPIRFGEAQKQTKKKKD